MSTRVFLDKDQVQLVQTITSGSTAISSLAAHAKDYILSRFRKDYFRHVQIDTATPTVMNNVNRNFNKNLNKIPYPSLMITPELSLDTPLAGTDTDPHTSSPNRWMRRDLSSYYYKLMSDPQQKISMFYTTDTITTIFNFRIALKTFIENADLLYFLKNELYPGFFQYLNNRALNIEIPKTFIEIIATTLGYDMSNADDMERFRLYMISTSRQYDSIRKKLDMATGRYGFFLNDIVDLLVVVDGLDAPSSIIRENQTEGEYIINFRLQITAPIVNNFILSINKKKFQTLKDDVKFLNSIFEDNTNGELKPTTLSIPTKLYKNDSIYFADNQGEEHIGINIVNELLSYSANSNNTHLNLVPFLKPKILNVHSYMKSKNLDISTLMSIRIIDHNGIRNDVEVNLDTLELDLTKISSDILLNIYVDRAVYETILLAQEKDINYFNDNFLTTLKIQVDDGTGNLIDKYAIVKSFKNEQEQTTTDINKQLRVNTIYGVGYIYIVDEDDKQASNIKVCIGEDKWGNKIIKSFVLLGE
jgi:hypothetical protein